ncbi:thioredoxin reductase [Humitalea rosea]|uniref:Thioredoxin reductase n=1 Tax=Humitalea rosea TaxID=990373 RepID=A0A2W7HXJ2_9PROT|nr:FAD-dependent oxidoreductase [Humitalea rosea]PZW39286.1 thioredoxin reductase [Humitalea rosea]
MTATDPRSVTGKFPPPAETFQLAVVGAGPAGLAAAIAAAEAGLRVLLIDENPVESAQMGLDVPLLYGGRATAATGRPARMLEQVIASDPGFAEAFDLGVDVRLGTACWGAFANGPNRQALPGLLLGLADAERSWLCGAQRLLLAPGARDLVLGFPGSDQPGVVGAQAVAALLGRYDAFAGRRAVVLGSGTLGIETALLLLERGIAVAAVIEARDVPQAPTDALDGRGVPVLCGMLPGEAIGGPDGVTALRLVATDGSPGPLLEADTVVLAVGTVPNVELAQVLGCALAFDALRGGWVPVLDADGATSLSMVFIAGDGAGLGDDAAAAGRRAALAAARSLGLAVAEAAPPRLPAPADAIAYRMDWMRGLIATGGAGTLVCQCEEVSRGDLLELRPPRYLDAPPPRPVASLGNGGPVHPDQVKRLTRAGMGPCQGRRCREQVAMLLALATDTPLETIPLASYRAPVRPLPLGLLADTEELAEMAAHWEVWFGIQGQWVPWRDIGTPREHLDRYGEPVDPGHL